MAAAAARVGLADVIRARSTDTALSSEGARLAGWTSRVAMGRKKKAAPVSVAARSSAGGLSSWEDRQARSTGAGELVIVGRRNRGGDLPPVSPEKLDQWTRESITEIMRNIGQAPFLVHLFSNGGGSGEDSAPSSSPSLRVETEPMASQDWHSVSRRWESGGSPKPDGIILVEELKNETEEEGDEGNRIDDDDDSDNFAQTSRSKTLGLLVQGRGVDRSSCYILNTCRVPSSVGACTHFCLVRAKCFGDTADAQLSKAWLQPY